jgi:hypothetical protein
MSQNTNTKKENSPKSFIDLSTSICSDILEFEKLREQKKFTPSDNESEYGNEVKSFISLFFKSMELTICCCEILDVLDVESKYDFNYLEQVKELYSRISPKIGRKT